MALRLLGLGLSGSLFDFRLHEQVQRFHAAVARGGTTVATTP
jgi:hypothetical protein